ncbi:pyrimidine dimer DNA glycosylase/endonuclease V [Methanobacterium petrolearium]|uniref:pyrimidine dimer DNA glycosylase/endonuclease V n=1 Tax=Methanobacterium petrolearium TaxID=710190 RepID=UPI001AE51B21|nr:pyrimidine dimer DNA glycosylase/endonuclease V [Methanobacterium petrolearium]MBP1945361.1 hypothetical protein [Methanobacterium petrolearium]BDZ71550.1 hypothetical protein GCM10025861_20670 [Methanobacterium petrolearium]
MRLWSLHPKYLDSKGLVAVWREGLLARAVLNGKTKGYKNHPQLIRFKNQKEPLIFIDSYLNNVFKEARNRGYNFDHRKIGSQITKEHITVTHGQMLYELEHLKGKLKHRERNKYLELIQIDSPAPNPIFIVIPGDIEPWEKTKTGK